MKSIIRFAVISLVFVACPAKEILNCNYEDTVDLTNANKLANGSYLYENNVLIPSDQVGIYEFEELYNGDRLPALAHARGCLCKNRRNCIRFCCHPTKEITDIDNTRDCYELPDGYNYNPYINVMLANGSRTKSHAFQDFAVTHSVPCQLKHALAPSYWAILENGSLLLQDVASTNQQRDVISRNNFCITPVIVDDTNLQLAPVVCKFGDIPLSASITYVTMTVTLPFLILTLLVYACIGELQNLHGKCFMSYLASLTVGCSLLCMINLGTDDFMLVLKSSNWCHAVGYFGYFGFMCVFFWLNIISFDIWQSFRSSTPLRSGHNRRFLYYSAYAWGVPLCLTAIVIGIDNSNVNEKYKPGIPENCWIKTSQWSAMIYYFGISLTIVIVNLILFSMTLYKIVTMKKDINRVMTKGDSSKSNNKTHKDNNNVGLFFRLFLIMGVTWIFDAASYIAALVHPNFHNPLFYVSDVLNAFVGPLIFGCFILNRKVFGLIKKRISRCRGETVSSHKEEESMLSGTDHQGTRRPGRN